MTIPGYNLPRHVEFPLLYYNHISSTNKTNRHAVTEILLKVALNTINRTETQDVRPNLIGRDILAFVSRIIAPRFFLQKCSSSDS